MVEGIFYSGKKKVKVGRSYYKIDNDPRFWQSILVNRQRVSGKLEPGVGGDAANKPGLRFDLDATHLKTAMRSSSVKRRR